jgi:uncharacterized protein
MHNSFIGRGWSFPPSFSGDGYEVEMVHDEEDIRQSLEILLTTRLGERTMLSGFGCNLNRILFGEVNNALLSQITDTVSDAILHYEPRIRLETIDVDPDDSSEGLVVINIHYVVKSINSRFNMVFPFYVNESIQP